MAWNACIDCCPWVRKLASCKQAPIIIKRHSRTRLSSSTPSIILNIVRINGGTHWMPTSLTNVTSIVSRIQEAMCENGVVWKSDQKWRRSLSLRRCCGRDAMRCGQWRFAVDCLHSSIPQRTCPDRRIRHETDVSLSAAIRADSTVRIPASAPRSASHRALAGYCHRRDDEWRCRDRGEKPMRSIVCEN